MSPKLAVVSLGIVPPVAMWAVFMGRKVRQTSRAVQDALAQSTHVAEEKISNIRTVRAFAKEKLEVDKYAAEMANVVSMSVKEALIQARFYGMVSINNNQQSAWTAVGRTSSQQGEQSAGQAFSGTSSQ